MHTIRWKGGTAVGAAAVRGVSLFGVAIACLASSHVRGDDRVRMQTITGDTVESSLESIDGAGRVLASGFDPSTRLDDLRNIEFLDSAAADAGGIVVRFLGGSRLFVDQATVAEEVCTLRRGGETLEVPIESIRSVCFDAGVAAPLFASGEVAPLADFDRIYVKLGGNLQAISGIVETITATHVAFLFDDNSRLLPRDQVYGVIVADFGAPAPEPPLAFLSLTDGSTVEGRLASISAGQIHFAWSGEVEAFFPTDQVHSIRVRSNKLEFLSDLEPQRAVMEPLVTLYRPWQADRSVDGGPLTLLVDQGQSRRVFEKGIGTHSVSTIEFTNERAFDRFAAIIGIDAESNGRGTCVFIVRGDGRELFRHEQSGLDDPVPITLDISGVRSLELIVEAGKELDLGDRADWCDARWFRSTPDATGG